MPVTVPAGVPADGYVSVKFVPAIADPAAPSLATDLGAAGVVDLSCLLTKDGFGPTGEAQAVTDDRLCSKQVFEDYGTVTYSIDNIVYIYDVQNAASESNKAYAALPAGTTGYLVARWGKDVDTAWAIADKVDIYPVKMGPQVKQKPEANSKLKVSQKPFVTGPVQPDVAIVA
jgi:hypothetical protein